MEANIAMDVTHYSEGSLMVFDQPIPVFLPPTPLLIPYIPRHAQLPYYSDFFA